jgi:O-antigen/teichoic acid export membrane protein
MGGRVAKNAAFLMLSIVVGKGLSLMAVVVVARRLSPDQFAVFAFAQSFPLLFMILADFGIDGLMVREIAVRREGARDYIGRLIPLKAALVFFSGAATLAVLAASGLEKEKIAVAVVFTAYTLGRSVITFLIAVFRAFEEMGYVTVSTVVEYAMACALMWAALSVGDGALKAALLYLAALGAALAVMAALLVARVGFPKPSVDMPLWKASLAMSFPLAIGTAATIVVANAGVVIMEFLGRGAAEIAAFKVCSISINVVAQIQNAFAWAAYPVVSRLYASEPDALDRSYELMFKAVALVGLPFSVGGIVLARPLLSTIFGDGYAWASLCLMILFASTIFANFASFFGVFFIAIHRQKDGALLHALSAAASVALCFILIPSQGVVGAAAAVACGNILYIGSLRFFVLSKHHRFSGWGFYAKIAPALAALAAAAFVARDLSLFVSIPAGGAAYAAALLLFKPWSKEDAEFIRRAISGFAKA